MLRGTVYCCLPWLPQLPVQGTVSRDDPGATSGFTNALDNAAALVAAALASKSMPSSNMPAMSSLHPGYRRCKTGFCEAPQNHVREHFVCDKHEYYENTYAANMCLNGPGKDRPRRLRIADIQTNEQHAFARSAGFAVPKAEAEAEKHRAPSTGGAAWRFWVRVAPKQRLFFQARTIGPSRTPSANDSLDLLPLQGWLDACCGIKDNILNILALIHRFVTCSCYNRIHLMPRALCYCCRALLD